jgi:putative intracellular protease/amidase
MKCFPLFGMVLLLAACSQPTAKTPPQARTEPLSKEDSLRMKEAIDNFRPDNHSSTMDLVLGKPKHEIRSIGILVYDGVNELDLMGPRYVLGQSMGVKTLLVALKPGTVRTVMGVEIVPNTVIDSVDQLDILVIPGGFKGTIEAAYDEKLHDWIRKIDQKSTYTAAVCTGTWILGATGLLRGKKASTNWYRAEEMMQKYGATFSGQRFTQDGKYWTSAGVTAGMDMALAIMNDNYGPRYTQAVMLDMEYDPAPPIEGGSPEKTNWAVEWIMESMYDMGVLPLMDSLEKARKP